MTVREMADAMQLAVFTMPEPDREVSGGYAGDLLSWVMGRAQADEAWVTIMSNINVAAVAQLTDVSCVILAENVQPDAGVAETAASRGVNLLGSGEATFHLAARIARLL